MQKQKQLKSEGYALVFDAVPEEQCDALAGYLRKIKGWTNIPNASSTSLSSSRQMVGLNVYNKDVSPLLHTLLEEAQLSFPDFCGNSMMCDVVALRNTADAGLGHCHTDGDHAAASVSPAGTCVSNVAELMNDARSYLCGFSRTSRCTTSF
jgi:hypothetical protein